MTNEESREVAEAREALIVGADHSWRCRYEPDPDRPDKEREAEVVRADTCCCGAVEEVDALIEAVRKDERRKVYEEEGWQEGWERGVI